MLLLKVLDYHFDQLLLTPISLICVSTNSVNMHYELPLITDHFSPKDVLLILLISTRILKTHKTLPVNSMYQN